MHATIDSVSLSQTTPAVESSSRPLDCLEMFLSPVQTLAALKSRPRYLVALLIAAGYATVANFWIVQRVGLHNILARTVQASASVDADTMLSNMLRYRTQILWAQGLSTFLGTFITAYVIALVLWLLVTVAGGEAPLKAVTAVVAHVLLFFTGVKYTMFALAVLFSRNLAALNIKNPMATNAAFFFDTGSNFLQHAARSLDIIVIAALVLTAIGLRKVATRLSGYAAALVVFVPWALFVVAGGFITALS